MKNGDKPIQIIVGANGLVYDTNRNGEIGNLKNLLLGLTKREYFAGLAMQGLCADVDALPQNIVANSINIANLLLEELEK